MPAREDGEAEEQARVYDGSVPLRTFVWALAKVEAQPRQGGR